MINKDENIIERDYPSVIVVEDERDLCKAMVIGLNVSGIKNVRGVHTAAELYRALNTEPADILVLDLGLPDEDGISIALRFQDKKDMGIIIVSARSMPEERILGLRCGADAYFVKPVLIPELAQSIENLSKRLSASTTPEDENHSSWEYIAQDAAIKNPNGVIIKLTPNEIILIETMISKKDDAVSKAELLLALGHKDCKEFYSRLEMLISRLRTKTSKLDSKHPIPIYSRGSFGYKLVL